MTTNKKILLIISITLFVIVLTIIGSIFLSITNERKYEKDLTSIFEIKFDMGIEEIIDCEAKLFNHKDYDLESDDDVLRLRFAPCETDKAVYYRHQYFFERETEELYYFDYTDIFSSNDDSSVCSHHDSYARKVLEVIGSWDETNDSIRYAYGNLDGVKCKVGYFNQGIYISKIKEE